MARSRGALGSAVPQVGNRANAEGGPAAEAESRDPGTEAKGAKPRKEEKWPKEVSKFRRILPQVLAASAKNLLLLDLGMSVAFSAIVLPGVGPGGEDEIRVEAWEASWLASLLYAGQPLGSLLSGLVTEPLGRRRAMMLVNSPHVVAWILLATARSVVSLYVAFVLLGLGVGLMEAPIITYIGEISEAGYRGTLTSYSNLFASFGMAAVAGLGAVTGWRAAALVSLAVPLVTLVALYFVPETPTWLVWRGRIGEAESALCWLRGWVHPRAVAAELADLRAAAVSPETSSPSVGRPLLLVLGFFLISHLTGVTSTRPYLVLLASRLSFPLEPYTANLAVGLLGFGASVCTLCTAALLGRRKMALVSLALCSLADFALAAAPGGTVSFLLYLLLVFATAYGCTGLVWTLVSEVFPFKGRSHASGFSAAVSYLIGFGVTKSFSGLEEALGLRTLFLLYGAACALGLVFLYFLLPETEGRTLIDIELFYAEKNRKKEKKKDEDGSN